MYEKGIMNSLKGIKVNRIIIVLHIISFNSLMTIKIQNTLNFSKHEKLINLKKIKNCTLY